MSKIKWFFNRIWQGLCYFGRCMKLLMCDEATADAFIAGLWFASGIWILTGEYKILFPVYLGAAVINLIAAAENIKLRNIKQDSERKIAQIYKDFFDETTKRLKTNQAANQVQKVPLHKQNYPFN